jgi:O-antigen/teichoic acid export membrane protein
MSGSIWAIGGQGLTMVATLVATPFTIRALGSEQYGILTLIGLLIGYAAFADLGMGVASTKFGAEANADADPLGEARAVWTSAALSLAGSLVVGAILVATAGPLLSSVFSLPQGLQPVATACLQLAALGMVVRSLASTLNTPQLVRLRLDLNVGINTLTALLQIGLVPAVLLLGEGLLAAVGVTVAAATLNALLHAGASLRLLPELRRVQVERGLLAPLARFGFGMIASTVLSVVLISAEKLVLARYGSTQALAHYAVATTVANLVTYAPGAVTNSLLPAFAQLRRKGQLDDLRLLYTRSIRVILVWTVPVLVVVATAATPFLSLWAGPEYGQQSTTPLYVLLLGILCQVVARVPKEIIKVHGRTDLFPRFLAWELIPYLVLAVALTIWFGPTGAAAAYSLRYLLDTWLLFRASRSLSGLRFAPFAALGGPLLAFAVLIPPLLTIPLSEGPGAWLLRGTVSAASLPAYALIVWRYVLTEEERQWAGRVRRALVQRLSRRSATSSTEVKTPGGDHDLK